MSTQIRETIDDLYCTLFVDIDVSFDELLQLVANVLQVSSKRFSIETATTLILVNKNDDFDSERRQEFPSGFLFFRYFLDIDAFEGQTQEGHETVIAKLLEYFWAQGYPAVASCDFEDELPQNGGYKSREIPWVKVKV